MKYTIIITLFLLSACDYKSERVIAGMRFICNEASTDNRASFINQCIKNANPKSDEEPEDWIWICQEMAEQTYCPKISVTIRQARNCSGCAWFDTSIVKFK